MIRFFKLCRTQIYGKRHSSHTFCGVDYPNLSYPKYLLGEIRLYAAVPIY